MDRLTWKEFTNLLREEGPAEALEDLYGVLVMRCREMGYPALRDSERNVLAVESFIGEMEGGGCIQYLSNDAGVFLEEVLSALELVGISELCSFVEEIIEKGSLRILREKGHEEWRHIVNVPQMVSVDVRFNALYGSGDRPVSWLKNTIRYIKDNRREFFEIDA